jgi:hypothetical protein
MNAQLLTEAAKLAALDQLSRLSVDIQAHINAGYTAHAGVSVLKSTSYREDTNLSGLGGDTVSFDTLRLKISLAGKPVTVDTPLLVWNKTGFSPA